jgi:hypothetical protein
MNKTTSGSTLYRLLSKLNVDDFDIVRKSQIPHSHEQNLIINLDDNGPGTHWVAMSRPHKLYFDPLGAPPPLEVPRDYHYSRKIIEGIGQKDCGQLCCLWLHYVDNGKSQDSFYSLFKSLY